MRNVAVFAVTLFLACSSTAPDSTFDRNITGQIDARIERAIADKRIPGGVYHLEQNGKIYEKVYGNRALIPAVEPMTVDTVFDAASITKVAATTPAIWLLIQRGKIGLDDPAQKYVPEFPRGDVTIRHLLTHTSGLRPDLDLNDPWSGYDTAMQLVMREKLTNNPGYVFRYSDINFELLGEIVQRVSGEKLDVFCRREIFEPLNMTDSGFRPLTRRSAPPSPDGRGAKPAVLLPSGEGAPERSEGADEGRIAPTEPA
ncbi:MAG TPA: serine hydrolase domain-containing protein, partial [Thermoanaerobaculia bacterium]